MYSKELIENFYEEAAKDIIFFSYASSFVNDNEDYIDDKNDILIFEKTIDFLSFIESTGDFEFGRMTRLEDKIEFVPYKNTIEGFESEARRQLEYNGLRSDVLLWELAIRKR